jgi:hypothetical protein
MIVTKSVRGPFHGTKFFVVLLFARRFRLARRDVSVSLCAAMIFGADPIRYGS